MFHSIKIVVLSWMCKSKFKTHLYCSQSGFQDQDDLLQAGKNHICYQLPAAYTHIPLCLDDTNHWHYPLDHMHKAGIWQWGKQKLGFEHCVEMQ